MSRYAFDIDEGEGGRVNIVFDSSSQGTSTGGFELTLTD